MCPKLLLLSQTGSEDSRVLCVLDNLWGLVKKSMLPILLCRFLIFDILMISLSFQLNFDWPPTPEF